MTLNFARFLGGIVAILALSAATLSAQEITPEKDSVVGLKNYSLLSPHDVAMLQKVLGHGAVVSDTTITYKNITLNLNTREISFPARFGVREDVLEVLIMGPGGRSHEAAIFTEISAQDLEMLLLLSGANKPTDTDSGTMYHIEFKPVNAGRRPIETLLRLSKDKYGRVPQRTWEFVGSKVNNGAHLATREGNIALLWNEGQTLFRNPLPDGIYGNAFYSATDYFPPRDITDLSLTVYLVPVSEK